MVSTGPQKRKGQKHQNKTAWEVKFDPKYDEEKRKVKLDLLCKRCVDQIMWKLQFGKYKRQSQPSRCNICQMKTIVKSYHKACDFCAKEKDVCSKCLRSNNEVEQPEELPQLDTKGRERKEEEADKEMQKYLKTLKERSKRTVARGFNKGTILWNAEQKIFTDTEGQPIQNLKFKEPDREQDFEDVEDEQLDQDEMDDMDDQDF